MRLLSDHRPWSIAILATAAAAFGATSLRLGREGDTVSAVSFGGGAVLFVLYLALIVFFGHRTKRALPAPPSWTLSGKRRGGNVEIVSSADAVAVDLLSSRLRAADINAIIVGRDSAAVIPVLGEGAQIRLLVDEADVNRALDVLRGSGVSLSVAERDESSRDVVEQRENDDEED